MNDEDKIEREVRHCREELSRRTSGLVQARENAETSIRKYRDEVERILQKSYGSRRSQNRSLDASSDQSSNSRQILSEARFRKSGINKINEDSRCSLFGLMSFGNFIQAVAFGMFFGLILIYLRLKFPEWQKLYLSKGKECDRMNPATCKSTLKIINQIFDELSYRTGKMICENQQVEKRLMSRIELETFLVTKRLLGHSTIQERVDELLSLILENDNWHIIALDMNKNLVKLNSYDESANASQSIGYIFTELATKPILCRLEMAFWKVATIAAIVLSGILLIITIWYIWRAYNDKKEAFNRDCFDMVDKITDLLIFQKQEHMRDRGILPYMALSHIHDTLIPLSKRNHLEQVWHRSRDIIGKWESRVRQENQLIDGEEYVVWRWLGPLPGSRPSSDTEE